MHFYKNASAEDYSVRSERLCIPFAIVHNATPASKLVTDDLPDCLVVSTQGLVQTVDAGANFATETDSTGVFGLLLTNVGNVAKLFKYEVFGLSSGTIALSPAGASSSGVTASGNIAVSADWSGNLATTDLSGCFIADFKINKS